MVYLLQRIVFSQVIKSRGIIESCSCIQRKRLKGFDARGAASSSAAGADAKVCIIGSGPAGFYTAMQLIKNDPSLSVDMYEKLAVPYGLVRYGVAPDHPEVTNCISSFTAVANKDRCTFTGNVTIGKDITVPELKQHYHAVVLASGAWEDRKLGIPGESEHVLSARRLVGWYNGLPQDSWLQPPLQHVTHAVVLGQGNVALDVARILLTPVDRLKSLDIPEAVLSVLSSSSVRRVTLVGRRGPEHLACTTKELREMVALKGVRCLISPSQCQHLAHLIPSALRPRRRLLELVLKASEAASTAVPEEREWSMLFMRSPVAVKEEEGTVKGLTLAVNRLEGDRAVSTSELEELPCDLVLRSIGYVGVRFDSSLPYTPDGIIDNTAGRVTGIPGVYVAGWAGSGAVGVIASTMVESFACAGNVLRDLRSTPLPPVAGREEVLSLLQQRGVAVVPLSGAARIFHAEEQHGAQLGKPREKITSHEAMLQVAANEEDETR